MVPRARGVRKRAAPHLVRVSHHALRAPPHVTVTRLQCRLTEEGYDMHLDLDVSAYF